MKVKVSFLKILFLVSALALFSPEVHGALSDGFSPSQPPRTPVTDFEEKPVSIIDIDYLNYSNDDIELNGYGAGYNYVTPFGTGTKYAFNAGIGGVYFTGESGSTSAEGGSIPLNANFGYKIKSNHNTPDAILFGGIHFAYTYIYVDTTAGVEINVWQWGPLFGLKGNIEVSENVNFIPYYALRIDFLYMDIYVGDEYYYAEDTVVSHLLGFDIEINEISIGAMFDMFKSTEGTLIALNVSFRF